MASTRTARARAAVIQAIGRGIGQSLDLIARLHAVLAAALTLPARAGAAAIQAIGRGIGQSLDLVARLHAVLAAALTLAARPMAGGLKTIGRGITRFVASIARLCRLLIHRIARSAKHTVRLRSLPAIPLKTTVWAMGVLLILAFVLYTLQWSFGSRQHVQSTAAPGPRLEPTPVVSFFLPLPPVAPSVEPNSAAPAAPRIDGPRQSRSRASALSSPPAPEEAREASLLPVPGLAPMDSTTHAVGQLSAKDRSAAERGVSALLGGVGGTELSRKHRVAFTVVEVVVPQSRYDDFTRGLTRLGSWQLEAARFPLPDAVHMTIRVSE